MSAKLRCENAEPLMQTMARAMPWIMSALFHVGALVLMAFLSIVVVMQPPPVIGAGPLVMMPGGESQTYTPPTPINPGRIKPQELDWRQPMESQSSAGTWEHTRRGLGLPGEQIPPDKWPTPIGLPGPNGSQGVADKGNVGPTREEGKLSGLFGNDPIEPPRAEDAKKPCSVVYLIDRSGSMLDTFDDVRRELRKSIVRLAPQQSFHVIFFADGAPLENPPRRLVAATKDAKLKTLAYLKEVRPGGRTDPVPAVERAFETLAQAPSSRRKIIFLLTDGEFPDNERVVNEISALNKGKAVEIYTILHRFDVPDARRVLGRIAHDNRGLSIFVPCGD